MCAFQGTESEAGNWLRTFVFNFLFTALLGLICVCECLQGAFLIEGVHTDIVCSHFEEKIFIVLTQFEKLGALVIKLTNINICINKVNKH